MSNNSNKSTSTGGITFPAALTLLFIALKLTNVISWPWIWVLSPIWISFVLFSLILIVVVIFSSR